MSYKLDKPYTEKQKIDFIVQYNHNEGLNIQETENALYALEAWEKLEGDEVIDNSEEYRQEQAKKEAERIAMLNMTGADVERAIYKVKGIDFDDILAMVKDNPAIDEKALKIEFKANNFFRGNPYIEQVGALLGFTSEMLDKFFDTKDYVYLTTCKLTINVTPADAVVVGNGSYPYGTLVDYKVELEGYKPYIGSVELLEDTALDIELEKIEEVVDENTTDTTTDANNGDEVEAEPTGDINKK